jgi:hypothetical protein
MMDGEKDNWYSSIEAMHVYTKTLGVVFPSELWPELLLCVLLGSDSGDPQGLGLGSAWV